MNARPTRCEMELCCTGGRIVLNLFHGYARIERGRTGRLQKILQPLMSSGAELSVSIANLLRRAVDREPAYPGLRNLVGAFYAAVQDKTPPPVTPAEVLLLAQVRDQLISSGLPALRRQEAAAHA